MYIGATYISELCSPDGTSLVPGILDGNTQYLSYRTTLSQPKQKRPGSTTWRKLWRKLLVSFTAGERFLRDDLGDWTENHSKTGRWSAYKTRENIVYIRTDESWHAYQRHGTEL